jgi:hypothetical protein
MKLPPALRIAWTTLPETARVATHLKAELQDIHKTLMRACRSSNDAAVRAAFQKYETYTTFIDLLQGTEGTDVHVD